MRKLTLDLDQLFVESFVVSHSDDAAPDETHLAMMQVNSVYFCETTSPCLNSQQTCGPECWV